MPFEGLLQRKSILFAGLLNFLNKPLFLGWPTDYYAENAKIPVYNLCQKNAHLIPFYFVGQKFT